MARLNKADNIAYNKVYKEKNRDLIRAKARVHYALNIDKQRERNRIKAKKSAVRICLYRKQYRLVNKEKISAQDKLYCKNNRAKLNAKEAKRRFAKQQATPIWLNAEQLKAIESIYIEATELSWLSEGGLEVDHIIPLKGENVSGLHVPWNLQILPAFLNRSKGNRI